MRPVSCTTPRDIYHHETAISLSILQSTIPPRRALLKRASHALAASPEGGLLQTAFARLPLSGKRMENPSCAQTAPRACQSDTRRSPTWQRGRSTIRPICGGPLRMARRSRMPPSHSLVSMGRYTWSMERERRATFVSCSSTRAVVGCLQLHSQAFSRRARIGVDRRSTTTLPQGPTFSSAQIVQLPSPNVTRTSAAPSACTDPYTWTPRATQVLTTLTAACFLR